MRVRPPLAVAGLAGAAALASAACATYQPGSFVAGAETFPAQRATIGCLDVGVAATRDPAVTGPVVDYRFGNRCDRAVPVDLGAVRVTGRTARGDEVTMVPYDPYGDLRALPLDGRTTGHERIAYRVARDFGTDVVRLCIDLRAITSSGGGGDGQTVTCLTSDGARVSAAPDEVTP